MGARHGIQPQALKKGFAADFLCGLSPLDLELLNYTRFLGV